MTDPTNYTGIEEDNMPYDDPEDYPDMIDRTISRNSIWFEMLRERLAQDVKWGGEGHDDTHTEEEWVSFIRKHNTRADLDGYDFREQMIKVAALAFAAIESYDRKSLITKENG